MIRLGKEEVEFDEIAGFESSKRLAAAAFVSLHFQIALRTRACEPDGVTVQLSQ
jgi:hypothetical protein